MGRLPALGGSRRSSRLLRTCVAPSARVAGLLPRSGGGRRVCGRLPRGPLRAPPLGPCPPFLFSTRAGHLSPGHSRQAVCFGPRRASLAGSPGRDSPPGWAAPAAGAEPSAQRRPVPQGRLLSQHVGASGHGVAHRACGRPHHRHAAAGPGLAGRGGRCGAQRRAQRGGGGRGGPGRADGNLQEDPEEKGVSCRRSGRCPRPWPGCFSPEAAARPGPAERQATRGSGERGRRAGGCRRLPLSVEGCASSEPGVHRPGTFWKLRGSRLSSE